MPRAGKVTERALFAIRRGPDIILKAENYRSFLDIYDLVRTNLGTDVPVKRPRGGYEP